MHILQFSGGASVSYLKAVERKKAPNTLLISCTQQKKLSVQLLLELDNIPSEIPDFLPVNYTFRVLMQSNF